MTIGDRIQQIRDPFAGCEFLFFVLFVNAFLASPQMSLLQKLL